MRTRLAIAATFILAFMHLPGLISFAQKDTSTLNSDWRRTERGWEKLNASTLKSVTQLPDRIESASTTTAQALATTHQVHRIILPVALAGLIFFLAPWCLMTWPTPDAAASLERSYSID